MQWLRLRPEDPEDLDAVDWRGRWIDDEDDGYDDEDLEEDVDRPMEDFDPVCLFLMKTVPPRKTQDVLCRMLWMEMMMMTKKRRRKRLLVRKVWDSSIR